MKQPPRESGFMNDALLCHAHDMMFFFKFYDNLMLISAENFDLVIKLRYSRRDLKTIWKTDLGKRLIQCAST